MKSVRLDRYFSTRKVIKMFGREVSLFLIPKKNIARIGAWADILTRMMASPVDFFQSIFIGMCVRAVFQLTKEDLEEQSSRKESIDKKLRSSQTPYSTTSTP